MDRRFLISTCCLAFLLPIHTAAYAAGGTDIIATKGQPAFVSPQQPEGIADLANDPARTSGWHSWFSEWPNDVNHYAFQTSSTDDLNRLIKKLASVKTGLRRVRLSSLKEPNVPGWMTRLPEKNGIAVIFSVGDQSRIDEWFKTVRKPFGQMEFTATPVAVPPTLTIFVQNETVDLGKLEVPDGINVSSGGIPTLFHKANTTLEQRQEKEAAIRPAKSQIPKEQNNPATRAVQQKIDAFLTSRKSRSNQ